MSKTIEKGQIVQIVTDTDNGKFQIKTVLNVKVESYDEETGKIIATKINDRTVGDPTGETRKIVITHKDEVRAWLSN